MHTQIQTADTVIRLIFTVRLHVMNDSSSVERLDYCDCILVGLPKCVILIDTFWSVTTRPCHNCHVYFTKTSLVTNPLPDLI